MALDREKILQAAQKHVEKKRFDKAIQEYQKIIQEDPNDARTLLKIGDLQARMAAYAEAIATYDKVGQFYSAQGFSLKAIAVYKQIRELIKKHAPQLEDRYGHIVPKLAQIYTELGLTTDALAAYDEVATRLQRGGRDRDAIDVFKRMVSLDSTNPLPHLRLAEACCRVQSLDDAINSFWTAAELLIRLKRRDDALKVIERILHFRQDARYGRVAAELYLERGEPQDGMQALAKLQVCFQLEPKNLDVLALLSRAFIAIGQEAKAIEVKKEMARLAQEQGREDVFREVLKTLVEVAPEDEQVLALLHSPMSLRPASSSFIDDAELVEPSARSSPQRDSLRPTVESSLIDASEFDDLDFDEEPLSIQGAQSGKPAGRSFVPSMPELDVGHAELAAEGLLEAETIDGSLNADKAILDAESFRGLRLYEKAIETLELALELDPLYPPLREKLRDLLFESGDRDAAIGEMITLATAYLELGQQEKAERELYEVLDAEPGHVAAVEMLEQLGRDPNARAIAPYTAERSDSTTAEVVDADMLQPYDPDAPLPSYDFEGVPVARAIVDTPLQDVLAYDDDLSSPAREEPLPSFPLRGEEVVEANLDDVGAELIGGEIDPANPSVPRAAPVPVVAAPQEGVEETLEEVEFFLSRGLAEDARGILNDTLERYPNHPLLLEKLRELDGGSDDTQSGTHERAGLAEGGDDRAFDIAASLDALDILEVEGSDKPPPAAGEIEQVDVDEVFAKFKEGVKTQVSDSDSSTHYDLGVAYKEMGLLPDAINEFQIAAKDQKLECTCYAMIGLIHLEQGNLDEAAEAYIQGLGAQKKNVDQEMSLYYDLGVVYEMKGSNAEALYYLQKIARRDPGYRDVKERIAALRPSLPPAKTAASGRQLGTGDELDAAFDDIFESK